ncbi:MAG: Spy0128 family protein [Bariatricus sp.]
MKRMKKLLAGILSATMIMSMGLTAFAEGESTMTKIYKKADNNASGTVSPAETFKFTACFKGVTDAADSVTVGPGLTITDAIYNQNDATVAGASRTLNIEHEEEFPSIGIYTYEVKETAADTAGVTYDSRTLILVVTVTNDEDGDSKLDETYALHESEEKDDGFVISAKKVEGFENIYSAGTLNVTKTVTGNLGDQSKKFDFTVVFTKPAGKVVNSEITASVAGEVPTDFKPVFGTDGTYTYSFKLAHGETATFTNIPYGVKYVVTETTVDKYETIKTNDEGTINSASVTAAFTNNKSGDVDTGINMDSLPYILVFAGVLVIAAIAFIARKRRMEY